MNMSIENEQTVVFYNKHADLYYERNLEDYATPRGVKDDQIHYDYLKSTLANLPKDAKMFEIGSAYGRDAERINALGYKIQVSDVADSFLEMLKKAGLSPVKFDIIHDEFKESYDYILANAVFVHLTKAETIAAIKKVYAALKPNGIFAFSLKQRLGSGEDWKNNIAGTTDKRYFSYWDVNEAREMLENIGFKILIYKQIGGMRACWLDIAVQKPE